MRLVLICFIIIFSSISLAEKLSVDEIKQLEESFANTPLNTFRFLGNQISCKMEKIEDEYACHRIGHIKIGSDYKPKISPYKEVEQKNGIVASVFVISSTEEYESYLVIGHKDNKIASVQYTGNYPSEKLTLASIKLMDTKSIVKKFLGPRYQVSKVKDINGEIWDYYPFPISIEFKDEVVYSMRISNGN